MTTVEALVKCGDIAELFELALHAIAAIQKIEHGSTSDGQNHNSFFGRWFTRKNPVKGNVADVSDSELMIERDRLVVSMGSYKDSPSIWEKYRVILVYEKTYNKWYMAKEKKACTTLKKGKGRSIR